MSYINTPNVGSVNRSHGRMCWLLRSVLQRRAGLLQQLRACIHIDLLPDERLDLSISGTWALGVRLATDQGHGWPIRMDFPGGRGTRLTAALSRIGTVLAR